MKNNRSHSPNEELVGRECFDNDNQESLPFIDQIMNAPYSSEFKQPELPKYDNVMGNPIKYLIYFNSKLMLYAHNRALMCKFFIATLQKERFQFVYKLKPKLLTSWKQLQEMFV